MPLPEGYRPREGDVVTVRARVKYNLEDPDEWVHLQTLVPSRYGGGGANFTVEPHEITALVSREWKPGMLVRNCSDRSERGIVVTAFDGWVVVKPPEGSDSGPWIFSSLEVEDDASPVAEPPPPPFPVSDADVAAAEARAAGQE
jgi:hypothetical protein